MLTALFIPAEDIRDNRSGLQRWTDCGRAAYTQGADGTLSRPAGLGCMQKFIGDCGYANLVLHGPAFFAQT